MPMQTSTTNQRYDSGIAPRAERIAALVAALNDLLRQEHEAGTAVLVAETHLTSPGAARPLPQIRVELRAPEDAVSRAESLDA